MKNISRWIILMLILASSSVGAVSKQNTMLLGVDDAGTRPGFFENKAAISAFEKIGFDFLVHHINGDMTSEEFKQAEDWAKRYKHSYFLNQETSSFARIPVTSPDYLKPGSFFHPSKESVKMFSASPRFMGVIYDEAEHWSMNGVWVTAGKYDFVPHFYNAQGDTLAQAYNGNVHNLRTLMKKSYSGLAENARKSGSYPIVATESVFPVMYHLFARAGMIQMPKLLKETMTPVTTAMNMGAAKEYGLRYWTSVDLWLYGEYPRHTPEELKSALIFSYWTGAENTYIENLSYNDSLYSVEDDAVKLSPHGEVAKWFKKDYLPAHSRSITFEDFSPEIIIVRFEDTDWGQVDNGYWSKSWLYGASNLKRDNETDYWFKIWNVISHGAIPGTSLNWNADAGIPYRFFIPANNVAVYDHLASDPKLYKSAKLVFLTGKMVSPKCLATLRKLANSGLVVVTTSRLAPKNMPVKGNTVYTEYNTGQGKWIVTDNVTDPSVKALIAPFLGKPDQMRYVFGSKEVIFTAPKDNGSIEVSIKNM